ncbi:MAG: class I SAM-dependent methyltransferase [Pseudonocardia sp.]
MPTTDIYLLGSDEPELRRLEAQGAALAPATATILRLAGLAPGMRVLDLGTGAGDVAFAAADIVGPAGSVLGVDNSADALAWARRRRDARALETVSFVQGDIGEPDPSRFDAVIGRLVLVYEPDPVAVLRRYVEGLPRGAIVVSMEFDMPALRAVPSTPLLGTARGWVLSAFERAGLDPALGIRLGRILEASGIAEPQVFGVQDYAGPADPMRLLAGVIRTLLPAIERTGVATADEVGIDTLESRLIAGFEGTNAVVLPPTLVGAWGRTD